MHSSAHLRGGWILHRVVTFVTWFGQQYRASEAWLRRGEETVCSHLLPTPPPGGGQVLGGRSEVQEASALGGSPKQYM